jgi:hypothetical protein
MDALTTVTLPPAVTPRNAPPLRRPRRNGNARRPSRTLRILLAVDLFEVCLLLEAIERHAKCDATNSETLDSACRWFRRCDELREMIR